MAQNVTSACVSVTLYPFDSLPSLANSKSINSGEVAGGFKRASKPTSQTIYVSLPLRPSQCTVGALVKRLFGAWDKRAIIDESSQNMTENEKRLAAYRAAALKNSGGPAIFEGFGHPKVATHFLPSQASLRCFGGPDGDIELCRASQAFDSSRPEYSILLKNGQALSLHEINPDAELDSRYKEIDQLIFAQTTGFGSKRNAAKGKPSREGYKKNKKTKHNINSNRRAGSDPSQHRLSSTSTSTLSSYRSQIDGKRSMLEEAALVGGFNDDFEYESDDEFDYGTKLLISARKAYYFLLAKWIVGETLMRIGPVSQKHTVGDLAVLCQRKLGIEVSRLRMTFRGRLLKLGMRLEHLGLINEHVSDPLILSKVGEATFEIKMRETGQSVVEKPISEKLEFK